MKLGVFTVSVPEWDPIATLENLSRMGYDGVEWRVYADVPHDPPGFWRGNRCSMSAQQIIDRAAELKAKAAACKMAMPSLATYIGYEDLPAVELHMRAAVAIGATALRIGAGGYDNSTGGYWQKLQAVRRGYVEVAKLAAKYNVRALVETHPGTMTSSIPLALAVLDGLDPKHVGLMWDPANCQVEGHSDFRMSLELAGAYLGELHAKNCHLENKGLENGQTKWEWAACPVPEGAVHWPKLIALLKEFGYDGWLMFEDFSTVQPMAQRVAANAAWFRKLLT
jgi:sugar phosphate isomerase/epimerase